MGYDLPKETKEFKKANCLGFLGTSSGGLEKTCTTNEHVQQGGIDAPKVAEAATLPSQETDIRSRWWLLHFADREPVEVACFPDVSHDEILERHPDAIAAEPIPLRSNETSRACSTCEHVTRRGGCGEPVKAGLSDLPGVIFYGPDKGATCPGWLATIPDDLMDLIQAQASRYAFDDDDLRLMHQAARSDRDGLRVLLVAKT